MMKRIAIPAAAFVLTLALTACSSTGSVVYESQDGKTAPTGKSWTVLVYMCGGADETENGSYSQRLEEIMSVEYPENISVAVQTGGASEWHTKGIYSDYLQRFEAGYGTLYLADQAMAANMGDYHTLTDFLQWGIENYSADKYMLILAGAGGGSLHGMAYDELNSEDSLTLEEISYAISLAGEKFDIIGFDSSLMGSLETASALSTCADYIIAPQNLQGAQGWDYKTSLEYICANPSASATDIGKAVCDSYYSKCVRTNGAADAAMSVIDISEISALNQAFDAMARDMLTLTDSLDTLASMSKTMDTVHIYGANTADEGYSNTVDLGDTAEKLSPYIGSSDALLDALDSAVAYRVCGERERSSRGLGFYYPLHPEQEELEHYMEISLSGNYKEFLKKICINLSADDGTGLEDYTSSWAWKTYNDDMWALEYNSILDENYELDIIGNTAMFKNISLCVYKEDKASGKYVLLGSYDDIDSDWDTGIFKDGFDCRMMYLFGRSVTARRVGAYADYEIYSVPVTVKGVRANVRVIHYLTDDSYEVLGAWSGADANTKKYGASLSKIGFFDSVTPALFVYDDTHQSSEYTTGSSVTRLLSGAGEKTLDNGNYIFEFEMTDIYGCVRRSTPVAGVVSSGSVRYKPL